eukprot:TRINITY_DN114284_c0_g1_i1.p1 TRINITY_DN114284_c0_g1~~TRINITY_DN114284_c0_g1_i1.p1  ORF type:complete len:287 (+),score=102.69 TRINITY_DN114284_c0_g1_i1:87-947(+)
MALFQQPIRPQGVVHVEFRAGKCEWDGKMVTPDKKKGKVVLYTSEEDQLMHFQWVDREKNEVALDLIFFNDAYFQEIKKCKDGRVFLLRFTSSDKKHFFWLQEPKDEGDADLMKKFNETVGAKIPDKKAGGAAAPAAAGTAAAAAGALGAAGAEVNPELRAALEAFLAGQAGGAAGGQAAQRQPPVPLGAVMTTEVLQGLMDDEAAVKEMMEQLPEGQRTPEDLRQALGSPQLQQSLFSLTQAIHSDQLPVLFASLGLDPSTIATMAPGSDALEALIRAMEAQQNK